MARVVLKPPMEHVPDMSGPSPGDPEAIGLEHIPPWVSEPDVWAISRVLQKWLGWPDDDLARSIIRDCRAAGFDIIKRRVRLSHLSHALLSSIDPNQMARTPPAEIAVRLRAKRKAKRKLPLTKAKRRAPPRRRK